MERHLMGEINRKWRKASHRQRALCPLRGSEGTMHVMMHTCWSLGWGKIAVKIADLWLDDAFMGLWTFWCHVWWINIKYYISGTSLRTGLSWLKAATLCLIVSSLLVFLMLTLTAMGPVQAFPVKWPLTSHSSSNSIMKISWKGHRY